MRWLLLVGLAMLLWWSRPGELLPPHWNPWQPLSVDHPPTLVTQWKLARIGTDPEQCLAVLAAAPAGALDHLVLDDYTPVAACPLPNVVRIRRTGVTFSAPFTVTCPVAVSWVMFERQALQPKALELLGSNVTRIDHYGSFACRDIYNREQARRSEHASANAFDVAGFQLEDGTSVSVLRDWSDSNESGKARFLREAHRAACRYFGTVLGPDYNRAHADHFHLEGGGFGLCR